MTANTYCKYFEDCIYSYSAFEASFIFLVLIKQYMTSQQRTVYLFTDNTKVQTFYALDWRIKTSLNCLNQSDN